LIPVRFFKYADFSSFRFVVQLFQRAKQTERTEDWDKYRLQKHAMQKAVRQAHWSYVNNVLESALEEGNSKPFWKYIKSKRTDNIGVAYTC
jgi:hypothetical protein